LIASNADAWPSEAIHEHPAAGFGAFIGVPDLGKETVRARVPEDKGEDDGKATDETQEALREAIR
jgi:hypothetical protein